MATQKQLQANRNNAKKSTGPRSAEGKARSASNALKSGIDAKSEIMPGESKAALAELTAEYYDRFQPGTPDQRMLVDTLVNCDWLLRRLRVIDAKLWETSYDDDTIEDIFSRRCNTFSRLQRRIDSTLRNYRNALRDLQALQSAEPAATPANQKPEPQIGFVPQILRDQVGQSSDCAGPSSVPHPSGFVPQICPSEPAAGCGGPDRTSSAMGSGSLGSFFKSPHPNLPPAVGRSSDCAELQFRLRVAQATPGRIAPAAPWDRAPGP